MQRRTIIKNFIYIAGGLSLLPSCLHQDQGTSIPLRNLQMSSGQEKLLGEVVDVFIPATDTPGAKELGVHQFIMVMVDDCFDKAGQDNFIKWLDGLNDLAKKYYDDSFTRLSLMQREQLLNDIEKKKYQTKEQMFYPVAKRLTVQGYMNSKYVMTNITKYKLVPGHFSGCVPVKQA